jgi:Resolvase, N terminal domain
VDADIDSSSQSLRHCESDSTLGRVYGIDSTYMKKAALYARVSGDLQAKEGTIESQVLALKKQIAAAGHVLVKEYVDNGFAGPRFDRPALNEMRKDVKTDLFDVIYFHDADRIAREVTIQTIIIEEILYVKRIVHLNGKVSLHGRLPVKYEQGDKMETNTLPFCIESEITREERYRERMRTAEAMRYQQSVALLREQSAGMPTSL